MPSRPRPSDTRGCTVTATRNAAGVIRKMAASRTVDWRCFFGTSHRQWLATAATDFAEVAVHGFRPPWIRSRGIRRSHPLPGRPIGSCGLRCNQADHAPAGRVPTLPRWQLKSLAATSRSRYNLFCNRVVHPVLKTSGTEGITICLPNYFRREPRSSREVFSAIFNHNTHGDYP